MVEDSSEIMKKIRVPLLERRKKAEVVRSTRRSVKLASNNLYSHLLKLSTQSQIMDNNIENGNITGEMHGRILLIEKGLIALCMMELCLCILSVIVL